jgi:UDP-N-acetylmuramyl tripeptide synthase
LKFLGRFFGKGTSFPGKIALKIDPHILKKIKMPKHILAVTGSNGKTSTVELIAHILTDSGKKVIYNKESNLTAGVATFALSDCDLKGNMRSEILLLETDERYAKHTFGHFNPTHYAITNLCRDQMPRNGHTEFVYKCVKDSIKNGMTLILNADDPFVSSFGLNFEKIVYFGANLLPTTTPEFTSLFNDAALCPHCKTHLNYDTYHYAGWGKYSCENCVLKKNEADYTATYVNFDDDYVIIDTHAHSEKPESSDSNYKLPVTFPSIGYIYNVLTACALTNLIGIPMEKIVDSIKKFTPKTGRVVKFRLGTHIGTLLISKHDNYGSYTQSIQTVLALAKKQICTVVIIVDKISRRYNQNDISWFWDADFEFLNHKQIKKIVLSGRYCNDLAVRFSVTSISTDKIAIIPVIADCISHLKTGAEGEIYVITCFSDKDKFLSKVKVI